MAASSQLLQAGGNMQHRVLRTKPAATYVGLAELTLEKKRLDGTGPRYIQLGPRAVGYAVDDLDAFIDARRRGSTSDPGSVDFSARNSTDAGLGSHGHTCKAAPTLAKSPPSRRRAGRRQCQAPDLGGTAP